MSEGRIRGHVAAILNRRELVLNVGADAGVVEGMRFAVLNPRGLDIRDPSSGAELGEVEVPKVLVEIVRLQEQLSVGRTYRTVRRNIGGTGGIDVAALFQPRRMVDLPETLEVAERPYEEELPEDESLVKIGDPAAQIIGDEYI